MRQFIADQLLSSGEQVPTLQSAIPHKTQYA
jgi:hypothetical protein